MYAYKIQPKMLQLNNDIKYIIHGFDNQLDLWELVLFLSIYFKNHWDVSTY